MSGQQIGAVAGGIIGSFFGAPQLGIVIGGVIGGIIDPTKVDGPRIGQGQQQTSTDGQPIAWILGTATVAGTLVQASIVRDVKIKDSGKGGPTASHHEGRQDFCIQVCESSATRNSVMAKVIMVEQDGKIVYDARSDKAIGYGSSLPSDYTSSTAKARDAYAKWASNISFQYGPETQLPHPTLEAITGVGNTPSYRGTLTMVATDFNITSAGGRIPSFRFTVAEAIASTEDAAGTELAGGSIYWGTIGYRSSLGNVVNFQGHALPDYIDCVPILSNMGSSACGRVILRDGSTVLWDTGWVGPASLLTGLASYLASHPEAGVDASAGTANRTTIYVGGGVGTLTEDRYVYSDPDGAGVSGITTGANYYATLMYAAGDPKPLTLADAVTRICIRGGLTADDIDVASLTNIPVLGYPIATQCTGVDALAPLLQAYFCYGSEYDGKIHFLPLGADAVLTIDERDLLEATDANDNNVTSTKRGLDTQYPRKVTVSYMDPAQNYMPVTVSEARTANDVKAVGEQVVPLSVVMPADEAKRAAQKAMKIVYAAKEGTQEYCLPFAGKGGCYLQLVPGDAVPFRGKRWGIDRITISQGFIKLSTHYERQGAFTSKVQAVRGNLPPVPSSPYSGPTTLVAFNSPSLRPQDTYGLYLGAASTTSDPNWKGAQLQVSYDGQLTWVNAQQMTQAATFGTVVTNEPTGGEPLTVAVNGDLFTVTDAQIEARANAFALIHSSGTEIGQFKTATENATAGQYDLTDLTRAGLDTDQVAAVAGDPFVMLDSVYFLPIDQSFAGKTIYLRAVGFGETAESATIISVVYQPIGQPGGGTAPTPNNRVDVAGNNRIDVDGNQRVTY